MKLNNVILKELEKRSKSNDWISLEEVEEEPLQLTDHLKRKFKRSRI